MYESCSPDVPPVLAREEAALDSARYAYNPLGCTAVWPGRDSSIKLPRATYLLLAPRSGNTVGYIDVHSSDLDS